MEPALAPTVLVAALLGGVGGALGSRLAGTWASVRSVPPTVVVVPRALAVTIGAALWAAVTWRWGAQPGLAPLLGVTWVVTTAADIDLRAHAIPDRLTLRAAGVLAVLVVLVGAGDRGASVGAITSAAAMGVAVPALLLVTSSGFRRVRGSTGVGLGDVKLAIPIGFVLGALGVGHVLLALVTTFLAAGAVTAVLLVLRRVGVRDHVPYGPYLALGTVAALVGGDPAARLLGLMTAG